MKITFLGDVHAKLKELRYKKFDPDATVIQIGDLGMGFRYITQLTNLKDYGIDYFIRGNHDNPQMCAKHPQYLGDYGYNSELDLFYVSGAFSIDRDMRTDGLDWWHDEELSYLECMNALELYNKIKPRYVVTHDAPFSIPAHMGFNSVFGEWLPNKTSALLDNMFENHRPDLWVFGHHHKNANKVILGTQFVCVSELDTFHFNQSGKEN